MRPGGACGQSKPASHKVHARASRREWGRTLLIWTPNERWMPLHSMHTTHPYGIATQSGALLLSPQSAHTWLPSAVMIELNRAPPAWPTASAPSPSPSEASDPCHPHTPSAHVGSATQAHARALRAVPRSLASCARGNEVVAVRALLSWALAPRGRSPGRERKSWPRWMRATRPPRRRARWRSRPGACTTDTATRGRSRSACLRAAGRRAPPRVTATHERLSAVDGRGALVGGAL